MKNEKRKVKNLLFRMEIKGRGIVNYDGKDQKNILFRLNMMSDRGDVMNDNVTYAKKNFYEILPKPTDPKAPKATSKVKISSDCLRNSIFKSDIIAQSPNMMHHKSTLSSFIASTIAMLRGYLFASKSGTLKRTGALSISDAQQTCNAITNVEIFSRSGAKLSSDANASNAEDASADTTFFKKETIGDITYEAFGALDLKQLQFLSMDPVFDRFSFNPDDFEVYFAPLMKKRLPSFNSKPEYYLLKDSAQDIPEVGVLFSNKDITAMVQDFLRRALSLSIQKGKAFAVTNKLEVKYVYDALEDLAGSKDGWITVDSKMIDGLDLDVEQFYILESNADAKAKRDGIDEAAASYAKEGQESKKKEREEKAKAKKSKASAKETAETNA